MLNLYHFVKKTKALGIGERFVIWVQGCNQRCFNCIVPDSWDLNSGTKIKIDKLVKMVLDSKVEGVTISGGEPFLQSENLTKFIKKLNKHKEINYIVYTGYKYENLQKNLKYREFLNSIDLLIDGEYIDELNEDTPFRGSSNQKIYILSQKGYKLAYDIANKTSREVEFIIKDNEIFMVGIPPKNLNERLLK